MNDVGDEVRTYRDSTVIFFLAFQNRKTSFSSGTITPTRVPQAKRRTYSIVFIAPPPSAAAARRTSSSYRPLRGVVATLLRSEFFSFDPG